MDIKTLGLTTLLLASTSVQATLINLANEPYGSMGHSVDYSKDGVTVTISAFKYDSENTSRNVSSGLVMGIDGIFNERHPAGLGAAKSEASINPPGIDNVFLEEIEFLLFTFSKPVKVTYIENSGLGPHGTAVNYWGGHHSFDTENFSTLNLGHKYSLENTHPGFTPDDSLGTVTWFAMGAQPNEEGYNVFSTQTLQFTESERPEVTTVPLPAAMWLFLSTVFGLIGYKRHAQNSN